MRGWCSASCTGIRQDPHILIHNNNIINIDNNNNIINIDNNNNNNNINIYIYSYS